MSNIKAALKAAKSALDAKNWNEAAVRAQEVLAVDQNNYFAYLFLGLACQQTNQLDESEKAYNSATRIKPEDPQAWLGLRELYGGQGPKKVSEYINVGVKLAEIYGETDDKHRGQDAINKIVDFAKKNGTRVQYHAALQTQLPTSSVYSYLEGRLPHPFLTYSRLAEITEQEENERINKAIGERRTRIGARLAQVTVDVKREVYTGSSLEDIYQSIIDWSTDDEVRRTYEEKLFQRAYDTLIVLPPHQKDAKRKQVMKIAEGMVIIKHPYRLAWEIQLEWKDVADLEELDADIVHQFTHLFPDRGLAKVLRGFLSSELSPWPPSPETEAEDGDEEADNVILTAEDRLVLMTEGIEICKDSYLAHRLMSEYYLHLGEHESAVEVARKALRFLSTVTSRSGLKLQTNNDAISSTLATSLIYYQAPRNHTEAKSIFEAILERKKTFTPALIGIGLVLEEEDNHAEAIEFLERALARDPTNFRIGAEVAWCKAQIGEYATGLSELETYLQGMEVRDTRSRDLKAQTLYRIGMCQWDIDPSRTARKDRKGAYVNFLAAIKTDPNCAPAYTALGIFYEDYVKDKKRARQCYQKAFELSSAEIIAAERMARSFADMGDWDIVEVIAQRVVDSGRAKSTPGSKKKGISWPFSALGVVQMNRQDYSQAIVSFLAALRISPDDYHSYVGLGESYHNSGRYNSAARAFNFAQNPPDGTKMKQSGEAWFTQYMLANVHRELGEYNEAISGYRDVLAERPQEFGVSIALLQTFVERAWRSIEIGFLGEAVNSAKEAIKVAALIAEYKPEAFNMWKGVGDACAVFTWVQQRTAEFPAKTVRSLLESNIGDTKDLFVEIDSIGKASLIDFPNAGEHNDEPTVSYLNMCLTAAILAHKKAIQSCSHDAHAQAVSWYNLGWTEYRAHVCLEEPNSTGGPAKARSKFLHASMRCFKRAIELEAGNADFWSALGVVTTQRSPKVAQHALVRSLHLNERSPKTWTNLGALYLLQNDYELAHQAFVRTQSTDPDYAPAWVGEGILALLWGDLKEARLHFTHAFEISGADAVIVKRLYATSAFDHLSSAAEHTQNVENLIRPLFAMVQLHAQDATATAVPYHQLLSLMQERAGNFSNAITSLTALAESAEEDYEKAESSTAMFRFASAKADLARTSLAAKDFPSAIEAAELALDLTGEDADIPSDSRRKIRLSAHLSAGLAQFYQHDMDAALAAFRDALAESASNPDVICLLAQVLWARGSGEERSVAREQLFEAIERNPGHVGAVCLLGVMGVLDSDTDVCEAVKEELQTLRMVETLTEKDRSEVERVLEAVTASLAEDAGTAPKHDGADATVEEMDEIQTSIMINPGHPHPWVQLADLATDDPLPGQMALVTAMRSVPPRGALDAEELAEVLARAGSIADAQRAILVAPWKAAGWESLKAGVESIT
ncbi:putative translation repressor/antiviral protein Ski3 [Rhizodiscina lignyota]|uniref:Translation repressor/antiviral protein Ski3 n=1 Tax=Rhizodiscina lignyota TaxID=1504668 RepID=A0A9P4IBK4_9PEZI|nr:putative translation repressor/antiviral protein Ski3 [Rhizodiscina lignyota]